MANLLVHVEQYDVVGILPSQLEPLRLLAASTGAGRLAYVDRTIDGFEPPLGWERYGSLPAFLDDNRDGRFVVFDPRGNTDARSVMADETTWLMFGPAMGWGIHGADAFRDAFGVSLYTARIPGGDLCARDAAVIALWEVGRWRGP